MSRILLLLFALLAQDQPAVAQTKTELNIESAQLRYYLLQAFQARHAPQRIALNHIGIQSVLIGDTYLASAVLEGYPAHQAGINRGDKIRTVNGEPFHPVYSFNETREDGIELSAVIKDFEIEIERNDESRTMTIDPVFENLYDSYRTATLNSIQQFSVGNKVVGYVRFWGLSRTTSDLVVYRNIIAELTHCDGLIFDLRNSSGFLDVALLDLLFPNRSSFFEADGIGSDGSTLDVGAPRLNDDYYRKPLAILLNENTHGGAELFAYQLAKLERVITIGKPTPGRIGNYQLDAGDANMGYRYHPAVDVLIDGETFEASGVQVDQLIPYPVEQTTRSDPQFQAAVNTLLGII